MWLKLTTERRYLLTLPDNSFANAFWNLMFKCFLIILTENYFLNRQNVSTKCQYVFQQSLPSPSSKFSPFTQLFKSILVTAITLRDSFKWTAKKRENLVYFLIIQFSFFSTWKHLFERNVHYSNWISIYLQAYSILCAFSKLMPIALCKKVD